MAGNRQHILPRFLLKGFTSRTKGEKIYTWLYSKNQTPTEVDIRKVSVGKHFYGKQGELNVDGELTEFEGKYAPFLNELRKCKKSAEISDPQIAKFITHLIIRTKHFRESYRESIEYLSELIHQYLLNFDNLKRVMFSNPIIIRDFIEKGFIDHPELLPYEQFIMPLLPKILINFINNNKNDLFNICLNHFSMIKELAPRAMKEGDIKGLIQNLTPELRVNDYSSLKWFIYNSDKLLILGDLGCLIELEGEKRFKAINVEDDVIKNIYLPISKNQLLIGTSFSAIKSVNIEFLNETIAKCSRDFFISSEYCITNQSLASLLGREEGIYSKQEIEQIAKNIFWELSINQN